MIQRFKKKKKPTENQIPDVVSIQISAFPFTTQTSDCFSLLKIKVFFNKSPSFCPLLLTISPLGHRSIPVFLITVSRLKPSLWQQPSKNFLSK